MEKKKSKYNVVFSNGKRFENMTKAEFYMFFHSYSGLDYTVYDMAGNVVGPFDSKNNFIGEKTK